MNKSYLLRIQKVQQEMAEQGTDTFIVTSSSNLFYLTGYGVKGDERFLALILSANSAPFMIANSLYKQQLQDVPVNCLYYWTDEENPYQLLQGKLAEHGIAFQNVALEDRMPALFSVPIANLFPDAKFTLGNVLTEKIRLYKDKEELEAMIHACELGNQALAMTIAKGRYWLGKTEADFSDYIVAEMKKSGLKNGGAGVAVGANAAVPHHVAGGTVISEGKALLVDFVATYEGYHTDMTRTFHFGTPTKEFEAIYNIVLDAHLQAEAAAKAGNTLGDVDRAARRCIQQHGYGDYFIHRTGHGCGLDVHEGPSAVAGEQTLIEPGMVFSIEPGIYLPGNLGVRIENLVAVLENETNPLHAMTRELQII